MIGIKNPKYEPLPVKHVTYDPLISGHRLFLVRPPKILNVLSSEEIERRMKDVREGYRESYPKHLRNK